METKKTTFLFIGLFCIVLLFNSVNADFERKDFIYQGLCSLFKDCDKYCRETGFRITGGKCIHLTRAKTSPLIILRPVIGKVFSFFGLIKLARGDPRRRGRIYMLGHSANLHKTKLTYPRRPAWRTAQMKNLLRYREQIRNQLVKDKPAGQADPGRMDSI
ncbi:hypothetical protein F511_36744 [Dorcoceras hygrometricum]|uniref:Uncharacterized protein n=1 Tax=Dorcoceras hygrometricum TaxID=472368 RepID=A0A2Z7A621_9LAMI|nr:hypothetical protein F511_36744 [Dorcoceras hygrometricum]